jgi:two-component system, NtrC family, response regulator HydG
MPAVLIVDDLISIHEMLEAVIQPTGFATSFATDGEKALALYKAEKFEIVLADIDMKPMDGITLLKRLKLYDPGVVVVIMTAYASTESAVQALKFGAFDYLQKPFRVDELISTLRRGIEFRALQAERSAQAGAPTQRGADVEARLIGASEKMSRFKAQVRKLVATRTPVLLLGENGTGKSTVAEILHAASGAPESSMVRIDCALASAEKLQEGLLGSGGTGGTWVQQAKGGTLFLQHLPSLPLAVQEQLVSVLRNNASNFRLVCSSGEDLERLVEEGRFHEELLYRIASLPLTAPPLRDRSEDIPALVRHCAAQSLNPHLDTKLIEFTEDALAVMSAYHWPGNVTELFQVVSRLAATTPTRVITSQQLPLRLREVKSWPSLEDYLRGQERHYTDQVVQACRGDKVAAAKVLGVPPERLG